MKLVLIQWDDPSTCATSWTHRSDFDEAYFTKCVSVGIMLKETDEDITLCMNINERNYSQAITFPKSCIRQVWRLGVR